MNSIITKIASFFIAGAAFVFMFAIAAPQAHAAGINENIPCSSSTMIAINGQYPNTNCWYTSVSGHDGQYFTVVVTVANSAPVDAPNVTVDIDNPGNSTYNSFSFNETIRVGNVIADSNDSASIYVTDGPGQLEFVQGYRYMAGQGGAGTPVSVSTGGNSLHLNMGTVPHGTVYSAKFEFQIHSQHTPPPCDPCDPCDNGCPPPPLDVCTNLPGIQTSIPNGYQLDHYGDCVPIQHSCNPCDPCDNDCNPCDPCDPCDNNCNSGDFEIRTDDADNIDDNSATVNGTVIDDGGYSVPDTYFYLDTSSSDVSNNNGTRYNTSFANLHDGDDFSYNVNGLDEDTLYYFKACGNSTGGDNDCGSIESFRTDGGNNDNVEIENESATNIDDNSATLRGEVIDGDNIDVWFELDTNENDVEDGDGQTYSVSSSYDNGDDFSKNISGLNDNTKYFYRACGEDQNGNDDCGDVEDFRTDNDGGIIIDDNASRPGVSTLPATGIGSTSAQCNGVFASNGASTTVYFKYGTNATAPQFTTTTIQEGISSGGFSIPVAGLLPNTLYYCRAYAANSEGTVFGDSVPFRTGIAGVITPTVITRTVFVNNGTGGNGHATIIIENGTDTLTRGQQVVYHVEYKNISKVALENAVINVEFPKEIVPLATTRGTVSKSENSVTVKENILSADTDEEFFITAEIRGNANSGQLLTASATLAYDYEPGAKVATEEAIAFDADTYMDNGNGLAGLALFGGFFPGSLLGWLIILLILLAIAAIVRRFYITSGPSRSYYEPEFRQPSQPRADGVHPREY